MGDGMQDDKSKVKTVIMDGERNEQRDHENVNFRAWKYINEDIQCSE